MVSIHQLDKDQRLLTNSDLLSVSEATLHEDLQRLLLGILSINIFSHNLYYGTENILTVRAKGKAPQALYKYRIRFQSYLDYLGDNAKIDKVN